MTKHTTAPGPPIRQRREAAGITMTALAEAAGLALGHLSLIETGKIENPAWRTMQAIHEALDQLEAKARP